MSHEWMHKSCLNNEWTSRCISRVPQMSEWMSHVPRVNDWVMSHEWMNKSIHKPCPTNKRVSEWDVATYCNQPSTTVSLKSINESCIHGAVSHDSFFFFLQMNGGRGWGCLDELREAHTHQISRRALKMLCLHKAHERHDLCLRKRRVHLTMSSLHPSLEPLLYITLVYIIVVYSSRCLAYISHLSLYSTCVTWATWLLSGVTCEHLVSCLSCDACRHITYAWVMSSRHTCE